MSGIRNSKSTSANARRKHVIKVAPMTRAVRLALAASLAALAMGASSGAFAGNCRASVTPLVPCNATSIDAAPVTDLTLVHAAVTPAGAGSFSMPMLISESDTGDVVIDNADAISDVNIYYNVTAINGYSSGGGVDITNQATGELLAASVYGNATGINGYAYGDVSIDNAGYAEVVSFYANAIGIYGYSLNGDVSINNSADLTVTSIYGLADGIFASGPNVDVTNSGALAVEGDTWSAGIEAQGSDSVSVNNSGDISSSAGVFYQVEAYDAVTYENEIVGNSAGSSAFGIYATGGEAGAQVSNSGNIDVQGGYTTGIEVQSSGDIAVDNSGNITSGAGLSSSYNSDNGYTYFEGTQVASGINATSNGEGTAVEVTNSGDITADGIFGATGIGATSGGLGGSASVENSGSIYASVNQKYGYGAYGIVVSADGDASIDNSGGIQVYSAGAASGATALSFAGDASVTNSGDIEAASSAGKYYGATGITAFAANGSASVDNSGSVSANSATVLGVVTAAINAEGQTGASVTNSGSLYASGKYTYGVFASSSAGDVSVTNTADGDIAVQSSGYASGIGGTATLGDVTLDNAGVIEAYGAIQSVGILGSAATGNVDISSSGSIDAQSYDGVAVGIFASAADGTASVDNSGAINAYSPYGIAYGVVARGAYADVSNSGDITTNGYYTALGISASSGYGTTVTTTGGSIFAIAAGQANGIDAQSTGGDVGVSNAGSIEAVGIALGAKGINAYAYGNVDVDNSGDIYAGSLYGDSIGIYGYSVAGDASIGNSGDLTVISYYGLADGIFASGANVDVTNSGAIDVYGFTWSAGIEAQGADSTTVTNSGDITALAPGFYQAKVYSYAYEAGGVFAYSPGAKAFGIYATGGEGGVKVSNSGDIEVQGGYVTGIEVQSQGDIAITNSGDIVAGNGLTINEVYYYDPIQALYTYYTGTQVATGINAIGNGEGATVTVANSGDIHADGIFGASGITATSGGLGGTATVSNSGSLYASQYNNSGYGAFGILASADADASINNTGAIEAVSGGSAYGAMALSFAGDASVTNAGDISVESTASKYYYAGGIVAFAQNGSAYVNNSGSVSASDDGILYSWARAVDAQGFDGAIVKNSGSLYANAKYAYGVYASSGTGDVSVTNTATGSIEAYSYAGRGFGAFAVATLGDVMVNNAGAIEVYAFGQSAGVFGVALAGDTTITNSGDISVISGGDTAVAVFARADYGTATVNNSGDIVASDFVSDDSAYIGYAAYGVLTRGAYATVTNSGSILAEGNYYATAIAARSDYGTKVVTTAASQIEASATYVAIGIEGRSEYGNVSVANAGSVMADGTYGAVGIQAYSGEGNVVSGNAGHIVASSELGIAIGETGYAPLGNTAVNNSGMIEATGYLGAYGLVAQAIAGTVSVTNSGHITATSPDTAYGILASADGNVTVNNSGSVMAVADGDLANVAAIQLGSLDGIATLNNSGKLSVDAALDDQIAVLGSDGVEVINNTGHIYGSLVLLGGDDRLNNNSGGVWHVTNQSTDFGTGNDAIVNNAGGLIKMTDGAIHMGAGPNNSFVNFGLISVAGDSFIDMGAGNTNALTNVNSISLINGDTSDMLTVAGNLGSTGSLGLDIDLSDLSSDQLLVQGNMVAGAAQHVDILFAGMPLTAHTSIDFARITGTSVAGSFVPGQILSYNPARNFLDLDFNIASRINAANTAADVFSVELDVVGLNDAGALAVTAATGAANMLNSQIGTFRQRMGVNPYGDAGKVMSAFFRTYTSEGDVSPDHVAGNFGQGGNFDYDQSTWGREVGVNANLFGNFHAGVVLGTADGRQRLTGAGVGTNRMDGMTWGAYATWFAPQGYYIDVSGRWMAVDIRSTSAGGMLEARAHTKALNLETGYKWTTAGGFNITPQLQYTQTKVEDMTAFDGDRADFKNDGGTSSRTRLGVEFNKSFLTSGGMKLTPYASINAIRESDGDMTYTVADNFYGATSTQGTSAMAELGLGIEKGGFAVTAGANWVDGGAFKSTMGGQVVVRFAW